MCSACVAAAAARRTHLGAVAHTVKEHAAAWEGCRSGMLDSVLPAVAPGIHRACSWPADRRTSDPGKEVTRASTVPADAAGAAKWEQLAAARRAWIRLVAGGTMVSAPSIAPGVRIGTAVEAGEWAAAPLPEQECRTKLTRWRRRPSPEARQSAARLRLVRAWPSPERPNSAPWPWASSP